MIRVARSAPPAQLTAKKVIELTAVFLADRSTSPWNASFIREALLRMSHSKCVYCETKVDEEAKYMEVDHHRSKSAYPDEVVAWSNLLPSCKRCNVNKGSYDVGVEGELIDPTVDAPANHLRLWNFRLFGRDEKGDRAIETLYLNDTNRIVRARADIGDVVAESFERLKTIAEECLADPTSIRKINQLVRGVLRMLEETLPTAQYSATTATLIASHPLYADVRLALQNLNRWSPELTSLEFQMMQARLPVN
jgi:uncharacterized protein (TIGR02646 family)